MRSKASTGFHGFATRACGKEESFLRVRKVCLVGKMNEVRLRRKRSEIGRSSGSEWRGRIDGEGRCTGVRGFFE